MADTTALNGAWVLVAGPDATTAARLRARLADLGASAVELAVDPEDAIARAAAARPGGGRPLPGSPPPRRGGRDRGGPGGGPPIVDVDDFPGLPAGAAGDDAVLDRLALMLERHRLRARVRE